MKPTILALLLACSAHAAAQAQYMTGTKLLGMMKDDRAMMRAMAMGYVTGVADTHNDKVCVPDKTTVADITLVAQAYLQATQNRRRSSDAADVLVAQALLIAYPCSESL